MFELLFLEVYRDMTDAKELLELRIYGALRKVNFQKVIIVA